MKIQHIVFDWDGTLADTYPVISKAYEHTFKSLNLPAIPYKEVKRLTSTLPNKDTLGYIFGPLKDEAKKHYYEYIEQHHVSNLKPMPFAKELLEFCQDKGFKMYLISNKKRPYLLEEISHLGFSSFFDSIVAAGDSPEDKPSPVAAHAVFHNDLPSADSILVIGDGAADYKTAKAYDRQDKKSTCVIHDPDGQYSGPDPDFKVKSLEEIINLLNKENTLCPKIKRPLLQPNSR